MFGLHVTQSHMLVVTVCVRLSYYKKDKIATFTVKTFSGINTLFGDSTSLHFTHFQFCMRCT